MQRKFVVTSVVRIYPKMWELSILFHELPNKVSSSYKPTFFLGIATLFLLSHTVMWVEISKKEKHHFFQV